MRLLFLLPLPLCRKPTDVVTYTNEVLLKYKTICFTDGSKLDGRVGLACVIYDDGAEKTSFQHRRDECSVFQTELLCIYFAVKLIQDSLHLNGTLNFLTCTDSLSSLHSLRNITSTEKLVVEVQSIFYRLCDVGGCEIYFSYVRSHSGVLGNERVDQLAKEATGYDLNLPMSVPLSHLAWHESVSAYLASSKAL